jgi:hypothetical protein
MLPKRRALAAHGRLTLAASLQVLASTLQHHRVKLIQQLVEFYKHLAGVGCRSSVRRRWCVGIGPAFVVIGIGNHGGLANTDRWFFVQLYRWFPSITEEDDRRFS